MSNLIQTDINNLLSNKGYYEYGTNIVFVYLLVGKNGNENRYDLLGKLNNIKGYEYINNEFFAGKTKYDADLHAFRLYVEITPIPVVGGGAKKRTTQKKRRA